MPRIIEDPFVPEADGGFEEGSDEVTGRGDDDIPPPPTLLDHVDGRAARLVSFEQEIGGDGNGVASAFYDEGLSPFDHMRGYHSDASTSGAWLYVEDDSSVDGEVIYSRLRLDRRGVARRVETALTIVQDMIVAHEVSLDSRCGFHVHVGVGYDDENAIRCYSMENVRSLYHVWNHIEDVAFRLGSANWKRHRSDHGNGYAPAARKDLTDSERRTMGAQLQRHRGAINFGPFLSSRQHCGCGAQTWGAWEECECVTPKPTIEFRVFNATANERKVRAYTALALALVGFAAENAVTENDLPVYPWRGSSNINETEAADAFAFVLDQLPLADVEREDIRYCAETSMKGGPGSLAAVL